MIVSRSIKSSVRSIDTTSPVSSSTKSSSQVRTTLDASLLPITFLRFALEALTSVAISNI